MYQIDSSGSVVSQPAPAAAGTPGWFTGGNPAIGQAATILDADWFNAIQAEMLNILSAAGITPSKTTFTQLRDAIKVFVGSGRLLRTSVYTVVGGALLVSVNGAAPVAAGSTWTTHPSANSYLVKGVGGGAGGGGAPATSASQQAIANAGQTGVYGEALIVGQIASAIITVGLAGLGGAAGSNAGGNGTATSFGSILTLPGGLGGAGGIASPSVAQVFQPNNGVLYPTLSSGVLLTAQPNVVGQTGSILGISTPTVIGGTGGSNPFGYGGVGGQGAPGVSATGYGAGGGGCSQSANEAGGPGGDGTNAKLVIMELA